MPSIPLSELNRRIGTIQQPLKPLGPPGSLSVNFIVKNEEKNIEAAVRSCLPFADEVIVNDTGSTDRTLEILSHLPVKVIHSEWRGDFSYARNLAIEASTCAWILWLDADDRVPADQVENFRKLKSAPLDRCFGFQVINTLAGQPIGSRFIQTRMFPRHPELRFERKIHEQIIYACAKLGLYNFNTRTTVWHTGYEDPLMKNRKAQRNIDLLQQEDLDDDPILRMQEGDSLAILSRWSEAAVAYAKAWDHPFSRVVNPQAFEELPNNIGTAMRKLGRPEEALVWFGKARELNPQKAEGHYHAGEVLLELGRVAEAKTCFENCVALEPMDTSVSNQYDACRMHSWNHLCVLALAAGDPVEAERRARELFATYPQVVETRFHLGKALLLQHNASEACSWYEEGLRMYPQADAQAWLAFETALAESGRRAEATQVRMRAREAGVALPAAMMAALPVVGQERPDLSLCMIVKDEARDLPACLQSALPLKAELIVVDTGSSDNTVEIAQGFGAKVVQFPWIGDFSAARNRSLEEATGRWILWLDADDRLLEVDRSKIAALVKLPADRAYLFLVKNSLDEGKTGSVFNQIRLFPNRSELRFEGRVHEQILPALQRCSLPVETRAVRVIHTGYSDPVTMRSKQERNLKLLEAELAAQPRSMTAVKFYSMGGACQDLGRWVEARQWYERARNQAVQLGEDPHIAEAVPVKLAECWAAQEQWQAALAILEEVLRLDPLHPGACLLAAQVHKNLGQAEASARHALRLFFHQEGPTHIPIDFQQLHVGAAKLLGDYFNSHGQQQLAVELLRMGLRAHEGEGAPLEKVISLLFDAEELGFCRELLELDLARSETPEVRFRLGQVCILQGDGGGGLLHLRRALELRPADEGIAGLLDALEKDLQRDQP